MNSINFGTIVIGEQLNRKIKLINKGALGSNFQVNNMSANENSEIISQEVNDQENKLNNQEGLTIGKVNMFIIRFKKDIRFYFYSDKERIYCTIFNYRN
jgi:hypothetical protein